MCASYLAGSNSQINQQEGKCEVMQQPTDQDDFHRYDELSKTMYFDVAGRWGFHGFAAAKQ